MRVSVVVADDEAVARRRLARLLRERQDVEVVAECSGGREAVDVIRRESPELVLLDVQMPDLDGFGVLRELQGDPLPVIVFVTAFDQYALKAFDVAATDFLLKPYESDRFHQAMDRALAQVQQRRGGGEDERLKRLLREVLREQPAARPDSDGDEIGAHNRIMIKQEGRTHFVRAEEVDWIESDGNYLRLHVGPKNHLVRGTISSWAERLDPRIFVRIHRRFLVNVERIQEVQPWFAGDSLVLLRDGTKLRLSRTFREAFQSRMLGA
jgi:two-component system, LytTR family, response regulator